MAVVLAFLGGSMAVEGAFQIRISLLVGSLLAMGGAVLAFNREISSTGRIATMFLLCLLIVMTAFGTGFYLDRVTASGPIPSLSAAIRGLIRNLADPANRLGGGLFLLLFGCLISFEHQPGE